MNFTEIFKVQNLLEFAEHFKTDEDSKKHYQKPFCIPKSVSLQNKRTYCTARLLFMHKVREATKPSGNHLMNGNVEVVEFVVSGKKTVITTKRKKLLGVNFQQNLWKEIRDKSLVKMYQEQINELELQKEQYLNNLLMSLGKTGISEANIKEIKHYYELFEQYSKSITIHFLNHM